MGDNEYDALSGWTPSSLTISESSHTVLELNALTMAADDSGSEGAFVDLLTAGGQRSGVRSAFTPPRFNSLHHLLLTLVCKESKDSYMYNVSKVEAVSFAANKRKRMIGHPLDDGAAQGHRG